MDRRPPETDIAPATHGNASEDGGGKGVAGAYLRARGDQNADAKPDAGKAGEDRQKPTGGEDREGLRAEAAALFAEEGKMWDGNMRDRLVRLHALQGYLAHKKQSSF